MIEAKGHQREAENVVSGSLCFAHYFILWMPALLELT